MDATLMTDHPLADETVEQSPADQLSAPPGSRSRRSVLAAAAAAAAALAVDAIARPAPVAAAGVELGGVNTTTNATTIRNTQAASTAKALVGVVTTTIAGPSTAGVQGQSSAQNGTGVFGLAPSGAGARGVLGRAGAGSGVYGEATAATGTNYGVRGLTPSSAGIGVHGVATATSGTTYGVYGQVATASGRGVQGVNTAANGTGVYGQATSGSDARGVWGRTVDGIGVYAEATGGGMGARIIGGPANYGIAASGSVAIRGTSPSLIGVAGEGYYGVIGYGTQAVIGNGGDVGTIGNGTLGVSGRGTHTGVEGRGQDFQPPAVIGVRGYGATGVKGEGLATGLGVDATGQTGVQATGTSNGVMASGGSFGVYAGSDDTGVYGIGNAVGVYGQSSSGSGLAAQFVGTVQVEGDITVNGNKFFLIDHPLDPANRTLAHACVEAPEALNVYSGTATLDGNGRATIRLPRYVAAINREYRYQLTAIGAPAPDLHVAREVEGGRFAIAGGSPDQKVCWIVTGLRDDPWARQHPLRVERRKRRAERGKYLSPELYGQPRSAAIHQPPRLQKPKKPSKPSKLPKLREAPKLSDLPRVPRTRDR